MKELTIQTPYIKLEQAMKLSGCAVTGGDAKNRIEEGLVKVNGAVCTCRGKKLCPGDCFEAEPVFEGEAVFSVRIAAE